MEAAVLILAGIVMAFGLLLASYGAVTYWLNAPGSHQPTPTPTRT